METSVLNMIVMELSQQVVPFVLATVVVSHQITVPAQLDTTETIVDNLIVTELPQLVHQHVQITVVVSPQITVPAQLDTVDQIAVLSNVLVSPQAMP